MRKFKFICAIEYAGFKFGEVYDYGVECPEKHNNDTKFYIDRYPEDWKEVIDNQEQLKNNVMRKWKFIELTNKDYRWAVNPTPNKTYTEDEIQKMYGARWKSWDYHRVDEDWEEVFEEDQYYAGQNNILSVSGTFEDVVFSLSGNFEKCLTVLDFISSLDVKK